MVDPLTGPVETAEVAKTILGADVELASAAVVVAGVEASLLHFAARLGMMHRAVFGAPLVITSARDSQHAPGSLHGQGKAIDIRCRNRGEADDLLLLHIICWEAPVFNCCIFDERMLPGAAHIHIEYHGV